MKLQIPGFVRRWTVVPSGLRAQGVLAAVLVAIAGGSGGNLAVRALHELPAGAVFRTGDTVVSQEQLQQRVNLMELLYGVQQPSDPAGTDRFRRSVAKAVAVSMIVDDAARGAGIVIADKAAGDQLDKIVSDNGTDRKTFVQQLGAHGLSEKDVLDEVKRQQAGARLFQQATAGVKATTDADAQHYYDANRAQMVSPEQRDLANIVVSSAEQAQLVAQQARSGADFPALAGQYSIDGSTKGNGGSLGKVTASQLDAAYAKAAFAAPSGSVFGPVQTQQGWNVGRVGAVHPGSPMSFDQVKDAVKTKLDNDAKLKVWDGFLVSRIKSAKVEYAPEYLPPDPDAPPADGQ
ncbi:peptidyl-prolyl cis-trans isomerase [Amycolatopsis saalfeldensis]|uniref:Peptidyl-prolyl cis-trans isomerase C n=1 Tax=Amycolatopsis saalfeldensis TaxID=394193 RepID=A0A1H8YAZ2_9PSEU|nr:peptidyl-prolyl cis-trans isomerase [Amycolatopsis saalfeldensis]SEP48648.1 peptidyl-prolyl cis-trans isomerase C [Amycolatopsis saalfeldensis]